MIFWTIPPEVIKYGVPVLVGAIIGYFTNYIAIKMLFHPRKALHIGKMRIPFTPGVIPKNQHRIALSVGKMVGSRLFTSDDISFSLNSTGLRSSFATKVADTLCQSEKTINEIAGDQNVNAIKGKLISYISVHVLEGVAKMDFKPAVREMVGGMLGGILSNPLASMFVNDSMLEGIYAKADAGIRDYVNKNGAGIINDFVSEKIDSLASSEIKTILSDFGIQREMIESAASAIYDKAVTGYGLDFIKQIDISSIVCRKIDDMSVQELEEMVMDVMKHELQAVINLGGFIGAVLGFLGTLV